MTNKRKSDNIRKKRNFCIGNFRTYRRKKEDLVRDINRYYVNICCVRETKMKDAIIQDNPIKNTDEEILISLLTMDLL